MGGVGDTHTDRCVGLGNRGFSIRPARRNSLLHSYSSLFDLHLGSNCGAEAARRGGETRSGGWRHPGGAGSAGGEEVYRPGLPAVPVRGGLAARKRERVRRREAQKIDGGYRK
jgi:hypothetical protein